MQNINITPVIFFGVIDHFIERNQNSYPMGSSDIYGVGLVKSYMIYPNPSASLSFLFLAHKSIIGDLNSGKSFLRIELPDGREFFNCRVEMKLADEDSIEIEGHGNFEHQEWVPLNISGYKALIPYPGIYPVYFINGEDKQKISDICFHYQPAPPLTADDLHGLKSRLLANHTVKIDLGCDDCDDCGDKVKAYTSVEPSVKIEKEGYLLPANLPEDFTCKCGKVSHDLKYYRESLHALLRSLTAKSDFDGTSAEYERLYSHKKVHRIVSEFILLLENERSENKIQKYIENNPVLLSPFNAKKLFYKPSIIGKYETDFVILDTNKNLIFIEIEKPKLPLFQKNGHPRAGLNHAYEQVRDWLLEYRTSSRQILERMGLEENDVHAVKGYVIAGILADEDKEKYRNHQIKNENNEIQFITFDELASSVLNISREVI